MSYFISEDMKLEDFDTVIDLFDDWCCCLDPEADEPDNEEYTQYRINRTKELAKPLNDFCNQAEKRIAELKKYIAPYIKP